jgi:aldose 1-epimerase
MPGFGEHGRAAVVDDEAMVVLRAGASEVAVAPAVGGSVAWYRTDLGTGTIDWLRPATAERIAAGDSEAMACFALVPFSNRIRNSRFRFAGRTVRLPPNVRGQAHVEHGHGWQAPWQVMAREERALSIEYRHAAGAWPFTYVARQTFRLEPASLAIKVEVRNLSDVPMPVGIGLHPYFPRTAKTRLTAAVAKMWETDEEAMPTALVDPPSERSLGEGVSVDAVAMDTAFTDWSQRAVIEWPERTARLTLSAGAPLSFLVVYTPPGEGFFCVEPVSNCTDAFNLADQGRRDTGMMVLSPGAPVAATIRFTTEIERS